MTYRFFGTCWVFGVAYWFTIMSNYLTEMKESEKHTSNHPPKMTVRGLAEMKQRGEKSVMLTAYDASFAHLVDQAGIEMILVGDSLGMVIQGKDSTLPVTVEQIIYHTQCVAQSCQRALLLADMPFMSYRDKGLALENAARLMQEGGAQAVKLEGTIEQAEIISALAVQGVPVCAHLGLRPQFVHKLSGFRVQGRDDSSAKRMLEEAKLFEASGADLLLLECVPAQLAKRITAEVSIPVIGIGAGVDTDAQVLVLYDILGISVGFVPKFSQNFMTSSNSIQDAIISFKEAVKSGKFPTEEHSF